MANDVDFDALCRKTIESNGAMDDLNNLYGEAFALPEWHFIARGTFPNINPYIASNADYAGGQQMIRAFTDAERLRRFTKENNLQEPDGSSLFLSIPTANIVNYLEQFIDSGVHGIWFNSDRDSDGFFVPLKQLRPIKEHLQRLNWQPSAVEAEPKQDKSQLQSSAEPAQTAPPATTNEQAAIAAPATDTPAKTDQPKTLVETLIIIFKDGLMFPSGNISPATYTSNLFCRVPKHWTDGEQLKDQYLEEMFKHLYGATWRSGNDDGSKYVVEDSYSKVFDAETVKNTTFKGTQNSAENVFLFYLCSEAGNIPQIRLVTSEEFQDDINAYLKNPPAQEDMDAYLKNPPAAEVPAAPINPYINSFESGTVKPDTSLTPLFRAIAPLLENYAGSGEFTESFSPGTGANDMSNLFEDITSNRHGQYLKYKAYTFQRPAQSPMEFKTIGSNRLTHVETGDKLIVNFTLSNKPETAETKLIVRFLGRENEVNKLLDAVKPALEDCEFKVVLKSKGEPLPESMKLLGM